MKFHRPDMVNRKSAGYSQLEPEPRMPHLGPGKAAGGIWGFKQHMLLNLLNLLVLVYGGPSTCVTLSSPCHHLVISRTSDQFGIFRIIALPFMALFNAFR